MTMPFCQIAMVVWNEKIIELFLFVYIGLVIHVFNTFLMTFKWQITGNFHSPGTCIKLSYNIIYECLNVSSGVRCVSMMSAMMVSDQRVSSENNVSQTSPGIMPQICIPTYIIPTRVHRMGDVSNNAYIISLTYNGDSLHMVLLILLQSLR